MTIKNAAKRQYQAIIDEAAAAMLQQVKQPREGWIASVRKALGMTTTQIGRITGHTRANVSAAEKSEQNERATLQTMKTMAEAMGCRFVYAIVPAEGGVADLIERQAHKKALAIVKTASTHMALEKQSLPDEQVEQEVARLTRELAANQPSDFWAEE